MQSTDTRALALIIDEDILTRWSLQNYLEGDFRVVACRSLAEAEEYLHDPHLAVVLWGNYMTEAGLLALRRLLARHPRVRIVTLVSDCEQTLPPGVAVVEKPFMLNRLDRLLNLGHRTGT